MSLDIKYLKELLKKLKEINDQQDTIIQNLRTVLATMLDDDHDCRLEGGHGEDGCDHPSHKEEN